MIDTLTGMFDSWMWLVFIGIGLLMVLLGLLFPVVSGIDYVFLGSAFLIGGLITCPFHSWIITLIVTIIIQIIYLATGRKYFQSGMATNLEKTNVDKIFGKKGIALQALKPGIDGFVELGHIEWSARSKECIEKGDTIVVSAVRGTTLCVKKFEGEK
jgi:membrane protein implicated in regulation of membrane protease activity